MSQMKRLDATISDIYNHVFAVFDGDFHFDGEDAGKIATAAEKAVRETIQQILDGEGNEDTEHDTYEARYQRQYEADEAENARRAAGID